MKSFLFSLLLLLGSLSFLALPSAFAESQSTWEILARVPVQHAGRIKPFESYARESDRAVTIDSMEGISSTELVWSWMSEPDLWYRKAFIPVKFRPLRQEFGTMLVENRLSPELILNHKPFLEKIEAATKKKQNKIDLLPIEKEQLELYNRAAMFQQVASGQVPGWIAHPEDPRLGWLPLVAFASEDGEQALSQLFPAEQVQNLNQKMKNLLSTLQEKDEASALNEAARAFESSLQSLFQSRGIQLDKKVLKAELQYNQVHPFGWAWKLYGLAALLFLSLVFSKKQKSETASNSKKNAQPALMLGLVLFILGFVVHTYGFVLRCYIAGRPPVSNMYESVVWVSWAAVFFSIILFWVYRNRSIPLSAALVASFALIVAESFPVVLNPTISPLVPVLRSNMWLTIHVLTITLSYGAFALAWALGHGVVFGSVFASRGKETQKQLAQYLYRAVQMGVILLASGTVLGGVWANYSWGRFWGWDPKETWALIALLGYLAVLHGRYAGWLDTFGLAVGCVVCFLLVVMAWYGVNFVLAAGLHSYGFGGGGAPYVLAVAVLDLAVIAWGCVLYSRRYA